MNFKIHIKDLFELKSFSSYKDARLCEAFCNGMRKDYSLTYPNGDIKEVEFKTKKND